ncbi:unnamed protein product [Dracunculus medinensis]|uniref:Uncharacterized protein n=1 Tax=Dracunculus medinensis TaxID=318479 RepID=A0A0N4UNC1_DRAME|nr:unnamed protein product [Dracunculus medinensis]
MKKAITISFLNTSNKVQILYFPLFSFSFLKNYKKEFLSWRKKLKLLGHQSSGIHVTPSPSDSGIVDYETIIRDKENELTNVRTTMEHNEEIVIRVYQEKERLWREKMTELKHKLKASQQGENALRQQIQRCNEQRDQFQTTIQNLMSDKQGLQRKV